MPDDRQVPTGTSQPAAAYLDGAARGDAGGQSVADSRAGRDGRALTAGEARRGARSGKAPTIYDVAARAGVSASTVSRVLNGATSVDPILAAKVRQAADQAGYVRIEAARALRVGRTNIWSLIVPDLNTFYTGVVSALEGEAMDQGVSVLLCNSAGDLEREQRYMSTVVSQRMAGAVVAVTSELDSVLDPLVAAGLPVVLLDRRAHGWAGDGVYLDNRRAGELAAEHLLSQGFTRLGCVSGPESVSTVHDRLAGFSDAVHAAGRELDESCVRRVELSRAAGESAMRSLLAMANPPDAVYLCTGPLAVGGYGACLELPSWPLGLVAHDDDEWTRLVRPAVTVIRQPVDRFGSVAARLLTRRAHDPGAPVRTEVLEPELVVRSSSLRG